MAPNGDKTDGDMVSFQLNGEEQSLPLAEALQFSLVEYIRSQTRFSGTKIGCGQGGCGACTVVILRPGSDAWKSVVSCLTPLPSVHGCAVTTVEGLAKCNGPHPVQKRLAALNGTQCGYCTPGMVMQMFATLQGTNGGRDAKEADLEQLLNGNICRCTGYRPLVDTLKSFAGDTTVKDNLAQTEVGPYDAAADAVTGSAGFAKSARGSISFNCLSSSVWSQPMDTASAVTAFEAGAQPLGGHTAAGIYPEIFSSDTSVSQFEGDVLDLSRCAELNIAKIFDSVLNVGAAVTWNGLVKLLRDAIKKRPSLENFLSPVRDRCSTIAGSQVRNMGTVGGNLAITREKGFASDLAPLLLALNASIDVHVAGKRSPKTVAEFLAIPAATRVFVLAVSIPLPSDEEAARTFTVCHRVAMRGHNSYANANFCAVVRRTGSCQAKTASIAVGAVPFVGRPFLLPGVEKALTSWEGSWENLLESTKTALKSDLQKTLGSDSLSEDGDGLGRGDKLTQYQSTLIHGFVRKLAVSLCLESGSCPQDERSAAIAIHDLPRVSKALQTFADHRSEERAPMHQPINKTTGLGQATGDVRFTDDYKHAGLHAALVLAPEANVVVEAIDENLAQSALGKAFVCILSAKDFKNNTIPYSTLNKFKVKDKPLKEKFTNWADDDMFLPEGKPSQYAGQPVAVVLTRGLPSSAQRCAKLVSVKTRRVGAPVVDPRDGTAEEKVMDDSDGFFRAHRGASNQVIKDVLEQGDKATLRIVDGGLLRFSQSHFYMEPQSVIATPDEDGCLDIASSTQGTDSVQAAVCAVLDLPKNKVNTSVRRVGGGFGGKINPPTFFACIAASAAVHLGEAVRLVLPRETDMKTCGGRQDLDGNWQAAVDEKTGKIEALRVHLRFMQGHKQDFGQISMHILGACSDMVYGVPNMEVAFEMYKSHMPSRTAVRSPGHFESCAVAELVMEGVSAALGLSASAVREANFFQGKNSDKFNLGGTMLPAFTLSGYSHLALWKRLKESSRFDARLAAVTEFNTGSRWKKRGVAMTPARYAIFRGSGFKVRIQICADASMVVHCAGVEMGQGLHTKVAQVISWQLQKLTGFDVPMDLIRFANNSSIAQTYQPGTGGSTGSELSCFAAEAACQKLAVVLAPYMVKTNTSWKSIIDTAHEGKLLGVLPDPPNLEVDGFYKMPLSDLAYETFGVGMSEVEVDVLTGESRILASHLLFDIGPSMNPAIDIGQMEGAFMMGVGQILTEGVRFDKETGRLLTDNTWTYKPPIATDVPEDFTVELVDMAADRINTNSHTGTHIMFSTMGSLGLTGKVTNCDPKLRSAKAVGEPPLLLCLSVHSALHEAIKSARSGTAATFNGLPTPTERGTAEFVLPLPATPPVVAALCGCDSKYASPDFPHPPVAEEPASGGCAVM